MGKNNIIELFLIYSCIFDGILGGYQRQVGCGLIVSGISSFAYGCYFHKFTDNLTAWCSQFFAVGIVKFVGNEI